MLEIIYPNYPIQTSYEIGLVITTFNRPHYVAKCFKSLQNSVLDNVIIVIVDDASDMEETISLIKDFSMPNVPVIKIFKKERKGFAVHQSLQVGWDLLSEKYHCDYLCNLDSDSLVTNNWLNRLLAIYKIQRPKRGPLIVTGFHAHSHSVLKEYDDYRIKKSIGGLNMFFDLPLYQQIIRPHLQIIRPHLENNWDWQVIGAMQQFRYPIVCTKPSVIQHLGKMGQWSNPERGYDIALDFEGYSASRRFALWIELQGQNLYRPLFKLYKTLLQNNSDK